MASVFISYKREDRPRIEQIVDELVPLGLDCWFDTSLVPGKAWRATVDAEIGACKAMLVCWTEPATRSVEVLREVSAGHEREILVPTILERCTIPEPYDGVHAVDLSNWDLALDAAPWLALLDRLGSLAGVADLRGSSLRRAAGRKSSFMLREILIGKAAAGGLWTYDEVRAILQSALDRLPHVSAPVVSDDFLFGALDATANENRIKREPPLCALVVLDDEKRMPGRGYFQKHAFLEDRDDPAASLVFARHLERVRDWRWSS